MVAKQRELADSLSNLPLNQRRDALLSWNSRSHPDRFEIPVICESHILENEENREGKKSNHLRLTQCPKCLQDPDSNHPLMTEDGRLILASDESRPSSAFNSRNSSTEHLSPRLATADVTGFQTAAAVVKFVMRDAEDIQELVGGSFNDEKLKKHIPTHDSIGALCPNFLRFATSYVCIFVTLHRHFASEPTVHRF